MALHALGNLHNELGDLTRARAYYDESLAQLPSSSPLHGPRLSVAAIALDQGRYDEAEALANEALTRFREQGNRHVEALALATLGAISLARGDHVLARARLTESITIQREHGNVPGVAQVLERFVGLAAALHDPAGAMRLAGAADALRRRGGGPITPGAEGRLERVLRPVRADLGEEAANAAWQAGRALSLDDAVAAALAITELPEPTASGSAAPAQSGPTSAGSPTGSVLTAREQEVATLIARGLTNRQIADALVITEGTAANHVVHILNKLGQSSRAQIAVWVVESGLLPHDRSM